MRTGRQTSKAGSTSTRLDPSEHTKIAVWAAAAGRCTLCNGLVLENEDLGEIVPIGELAHNVGWGDQSPRGASEVTADERRSAENLLLVCRSCHMPVDDAGAARRYTVEELTKRKREHEQRIRFLTEIDADRRATIVRVVGPVRGANPELTYNTVLGATTAAGLYPTLLPGSSSAEQYLDLRHLTDLGTPAFFSTCAGEIDGLVNRIDDGIRRGAITRLAVFGFARIPLLIHLGARLDDKVPTLVFQRQRVDDINAWRWPVDPSDLPAFETRQIRPGTNPEHVAVTINLSGTIRLEELPVEIADSYAIYAITPIAPAEPHPSLISSPAAMQNFDYAVRQFLARVEVNHGKIQRIALFPAIPVSAALTLGRVLMPDVSPAWSVFDRGEDRQFFAALEVRR